MFGSKQRRKNRDNALREAYFHEKGYDFQIPEDTEGRVDIICKMLNSLTPDYDAIIMLFDPEMDRENGDMLNLMGVIYDDTGFQNFNAERATALRLEAASKGSAAAAYNIGSSWYNGFNGPINYEEAAFWYQKAHDLGHGCAISVLAPLMRHKDGNTPETEQKIEKMYEEALERGGPWAWYGQSIREIRDPKSELYHPEKALHNLDVLTSDSMCGKPRAHASKVLALHYYLGIAVDQNLDKAEYYFERIPETERDPEVRYRIHNLANKVKNMMQNRQSYEEYREAFAVARRAYETGQFPNRMPDTEAMSNVLWAVNQLADEEDWPNQCEWSSFWQSVQLDLIGLEHSDVEKATYDFGPFYNKLDQTKTPILGAYEQPGTYLSPVGGLASVTGVDGTRSGEIKITGIPANENTLTFITDEDINVAMILAFGDLSGPIWPSLSIDPYQKMTKDNLRWTFKRKVFNPEWIGHTALGKTLYSTDYWLGKLAWTPWQFNRHLNGELSEEQNGYIHALTSELTNVGGRDDGLWHRVMLKPQYMVFDWKKPILGGLSCKVKAATIMVDGSDDILTNNDTEQIMNLNDERFHTGRAAGLITDYYNNIAQLFPIYERNRQLMILMYALNGMREKGFKLDKQSQETVDEGYMHYRSLPKLQMHDLVIK